MITISASYGSGGSEVAARLAQQLGAGLLDRAIPAEVAERLAVPLEHATDRDETMDSMLGRLAASFAPAAVVFGAPWSSHADLEIIQGSGGFARAAEKVICEHAERGNVVVLGRAGALVLHDRADAFHVRLDGPPAGRAARAATMLGIDRDDADRQLAQTDQAREAYVRHFYKCDPRDARHYHLVLDATAYSLDDLVLLIGDAHRAWERARAGTRP